MNFTLVIGIGLVALASLSAPPLRAEPGPQQREILYWVAPMDPNYRRDKPGKSPMGMELIPVYADADSGGDAGVSIPPAVVQNLGVRTAAARRALLWREIDTVGYVGYDESRVSHVHLRAETATDPAPLTMAETTIQLKPRDQWRPGMTPDKLKQELNALVQLPGLTNAWVMPIKNRIDMLATGIKTPVGVKVAGPDLEEIQRVSKRIEDVLKAVEQRLQGLGVPGISVSKAKGYGDYADFYRADWMTSHVRVEVITRGDQAEPVATAIMEGAHTGLDGDGLVVISPVTALYHIRTRTRCRGDVC